MYLFCLFSCKVGISGYFLYYLIDRRCTWCTQHSFSIRCDYFCSNSIANVICSLLFGERYDYSDLEFKEMRHLVDDGFLLVGKTYDLNFVPEMRFMPSMKEQYSKFFLKRHQFQSPIQNGFLGLLCLTFKAKAKHFTD